MEIKAGDTVEFIDTKSVLVGKNYKTVKVTKHGVWDGNQVILNDKERTTVFNTKWLTKTMKVNIEPHSGIDKSFEMFDDERIFSMQFDYDDVNHSEVDAAADVIKEIIEKHWDQQLYQKKYKEYVMKIWLQNYGIDEI